MIVAAFVQISDPAQTFAARWIDIDECAFRGRCNERAIVARERTAGQAARRFRLVCIDNRLARRLQTLFDLAQHRQNFGCVRVAGQDHFALLKRRRVGTGVEIRFRQFPRSPERVVVTSDFGVSLPQNLERLIILGLCLSDRLKHLDRLEDLAMLLRRKRVFQHAALQKLEACPYRSGADKFTLKSANFSILLNRCHLGRYKPRIRRLSLVSRANPVFRLPRPSPPECGGRRTFSLFTISRLCCTLKFVSPFPTRRVFTLRQRERLSAFTLPSNFRSPVSGL